MTRASLLGSSGLVALVALLGCGSSHTHDTDCGTGTFLEDTLGHYCAYIVVEGGWSCPADVPHAIEVDGAGVCTDRDIDRGDLPAAVCREIDRDCGLPLFVDGGTDAGDGMCAIRGSMDCAALAAVSIDLTVEQCMQCQGVACGTDAECDGFFPCVDGTVQIVGCCEDTDCGDIAPFCGQFIGVNDVCVPDDDI